MSKDDEEIRKQLDIFNAIAENANAVIGAKDLEGRYIYVNSEYSRLFHLDKSQFIGRRDEDIFPPEIAKQFHDSDLQALESRSGISIEQKAPINGELRDYLSIKFPIIDENGATYAVGLIGTDITDKKRLQMQMQVYAERDALTGVYNRRKLFEIGESEFERSRRYHYPFSVLMFDIDHFKNINDSYGHAVGDLVIKRFAQICANALRKQDTIGRIGGEEFVALLPHTDADKAAMLAQRIQAALVEQQGVKEDDSVIAVTVSVGVAAMDANHKNFDQLLNHADEAMYQAKTDGRNCVRVSS